jgi:predicted lipoprotein with Yx(FWY)xxD motif
MAMDAMRKRTSRKVERVRRRAITRGVLALPLTVALGVAGFLTVGVSGGETRSNATVSVRKTNLGSILVNSRGHTLYLFAKDRNGRSSCSGSCARFWPPLLSRAKPTAGPGVKASLLGTTRRSNGSLQVTYNKRPLYTYALDKQAGQTKGQRVLASGARWYAVSASGAAVLRAPTTTSTTPTTTRGTTTTPPTTTGDDCPYPPCG